MPPLSTLSLGLFGFIGGGSSLGGQTLAQLAGHAVPGLGADAAPALAFGT